MWSVFRNSVIVSVAALAAMVFIGQAEAAPIPAYTVNPTFSKAADADTNAYSSIGFRFTTAADYYVTHLGYNANEAFANTWQVSITDDSNAALSPALTAPVTVPAGSGETGATNFIYTELNSPYLLPAGTYRIVAPVPAGNQSYHFSTDPNDDIESPGISYLEGIVNGGTSGARFYNVNFQFDVVPEPGALGLLCVGAAGLLARRRRA